MLAYPFLVLHQFGNILEDAGVQPLKDVLDFFIYLHAERVVDMARTVGFGRDKFPAAREFFEDFLYLFTHLPMSVYKPSASNFAKALLTKSVSSLYVTPNHLASVRSTFTFTSPAWIMLSTTLGM